MDAASPAGRVLSIFDGKRTFSSVVKLRNFDSISEDTATERPRGMYYTRSGKSYMEISPHMS